LEFILCLWVAWDKGGRQRPARCSSSWSKASEPGGQAPRSRSSKDDSGLCGGILIVEMEGGSYKPVGLVISIIEAIEIVQGDTATG
jgi:hypothetical protein